MLMETALILAGVALTAYALLWAMVRGRLPVAWDIPNERSLHGRAVPRSGGLAIVVGLGVAALALGNREVFGFYGAVVGLAVISLLDDYRNLPAGIRLLAHLAAACSLFFGAAPPVGLALGIILAVAWMTNLFNFMDGSDGLAGGMALIGFAAYALGFQDGGASALAVGCAALAVAAAVFLGFNFAPARVFMGDVGSVPLGFLAGALGYTGWAKGLWPGWFAPLVFSPFIVDATVTLLRRALRGERVWAAHREHYYQRLIRMGWSHRRTALAAYGLMLVCAGLALTLRQAPPETVILALLVLTAAYGWGARAIDVKWRAAQSAGLVQ